MQRCEKDSNDLYSMKLKFHCFVFQIWSCKSVGKNNHRSQTFINNGYRCFSVCWIKKPVFCVARSGLKKPCSSSSTSTTTTTTAATRIEEDFLAKFHNRVQRCTTQQQQPREGKKGADAWTHHLAPPESPLPNTTTAPVHALANEEPETGQSHITPGERTSAV